MKSDKETIIYSFLVGNFWWNIRTLDIAAINYSASSLVSANRPWTPHHIFLPPFFLVFSVLCIFPSLSSHILYSCFLEFPLIPPLLQHRRSGFISLSYTFFLVSRCFLFVFSHPKLSGSSLGLFCSSTPSKYSPWINATRFNNLLFFLFELLC